MISIYDKLFPVMGMEMTFGEKLRLLREELELNQTELGRELGMTQRKISYLERDRYEPSLQDIQSICAYFRVSADYMLGFPKPFPYPRKNQRN